MLPEGWRRSTLGEIARITSGGTPDRSEPSYWDGSVPWVTTGEIQFNTITDTTEKITEAGLRNSSAKLFPPGTLLMAMYGQGKTRGQVAKLGIEASTNQACAAILLRPEHSPDFYYHYLSAHYEVLRSLGNAGAQQNLSAGILKDVEVLVPPFQEQLRIAAVLATWDASIEVARKVAARADRQLDALASVVLFGRRRLGQAAGSSVQHSPQGPIPFDWQYVPIGDIADEVSMRPNEHDALPVLSCTKHGGLVDSLQYFKKRVFSEDTSKYKVAPRGSFVYATNHIEEGSLGYQDLYDAGLVSPIYTVFRTRSSVCDAYLHALLKTEHYRQIFSAATNASVDRRGSLRWKDFRTLKVPLPSLGEQRAIAGVLNDARREGVLLKQRAVALEQEKQALMADLLTARRRVRVAAAEAAA